MEIHCIFFPSPLPVTIYLLDTTDVFNFAHFLHVYVCTFQLMVNYYQQERGVVFKRFYEVNLAAADG